MKNSKEEESFEVIKIVQGHGHFNVGDPVFYMKDNRITEDHIFSVLRVESLTHEKKDHLIVKVRRQEYYWNGFKYKYSTVNNPGMYLEPDRLFATKDELIEDLFKNVKK